MVTSASWHLWLIPRGIASEQEEAFPLEHEDYIVYGLHRHMLSHRVNVPAITHVCVSLYLCLSVHYRYTVVDTVTKYNYTQ